MTVLEKGLLSGLSPSQSYVLRSATTLFIAVAVFVPGRLASLRLYFFGNRNRLAVRVQQYLIRIETKALLGLKGANHPVPVHLTRPEVRHEHVPVMVGLVGLRVQAYHARGQRIVCSVEQQQLDGDRTLRKHAEVHACGTYRCPQRIAVTTTYVIDHATEPLS